MIESIEEAKECLKYVSSYRQNIVFLRELILCSNGCVDKINNTYEAHAFNFVLSTLHSRMVIDLRKILEPSGKDKKNNISALIKYIKKNKDFLVNKHFENYYTIPTIYMGSISPQKTPEFTSFFERRKKAGAEEAAKKCSDRITLIIKQWDRVWTLLKKESLDIVPARTVITHSVNPTISKIPSLDKIKKLLKIATYFIKNIFYIIDNSSYDYKLEQIQLHEISNRFWSRI